MHGVIEGHDGCRFRSDLVEGVVLARVPVIADAAYHQDRHILLFAGIENAKCFHCADVEVGAKAEARAEEVKAFRGLTLRSCLSGKPLDQLAFYM